MTTYVLEMRSTADWQHIRYREYTTSAKKAKLFENVPRISFTDSGHGIVPHVREHSGHREHRNMLLADHVQDYIKAVGQQVRPKLRSGLTEKNVERVARALCTESGDDPDSKTYSHAMHCTGRENAPEFRWMYWIGFAKASIEAYEKE